MIEIEVSDVSSLKGGAPCLHCMVMGLVRAYWMEFGRKDGSGAVSVDVPLTVAKLAEAMANVIVCLDSEADRDRMTGDAHAVLDAFSKTMQTGEPIEMTIGGQGKVH